MTAWTEHAWLSCNVPGATDSPRAHSIPASFSERAGAFPGCLCPLPSPRERQRVAEGRAAAILSSLLPSSARSRAARPSSSSPGTTGTASLPLLTHTHGPAEPWLLLLPNRGLPSCFNSVPPCNTESPKASCSPISGCRPQRAAAFRAGDVWVSPAAGPASGPFPWAL